MMSLKLSVSRHVA